MADRTTKLEALRAQLARCEQSQGTGHNVAYMNRLRDQIARLEKPRKQTRRGRPGWTRKPGIYGGQTGAMYRLDGTDYFVKHCGHPTALWPYYGIDPQGKMILAPNGRAFALLADAQAAVEALARGALP